MPTVLCSSADPFTAVCAAGAAHVATGDVRGRVCLWAIAQAVGVDDSPPHEPLLLLHEGEEVGGLAVTGMDYHPPSDTLVCVFGSSCSRAWPLSALLEHGPARCRAQSYAFPRSNAEATRRTSHVALHASVCVVLTQGQSWSHVMDLRTMSDCKPNIASATSTLPTHLVVASDGDSLRGGGRHASSDGTFVAGARFGTPPHDVEEEGGGGCRRCWRCTPGLRARA